MTFKSQFDLGEVVYIKHEPDQSQWFVTGVCFRHSEENYELSCGLIQTNAFAYELSREENTLLKVTQ